MTTEQQATREVQKQSTVSKHILTSQNGKLKPDTPAQCLLKSIFKHGIPDQIISNHGTNFQSKVIREICDVLDIRGFDWFFSGVDAEGPKPSPISLSCEQWFRISSKLPEFLDSPQSRL
jgi:hypothetical protein